VGFQQWPPLAGHSQAVQVLSVIASSVDTPRGTLAWAWGPVFLSGLSQRSPACLGPWMGSSGAAPGVARHSQKGQLQSTCCSCHGSHLCSPQFTDVCSRELRTPGFAPSYKGSKPSTKKPINPRYHRLPWNEASPGPGHLELLASLFREAGSGEVSVHRWGCLWSQVLSACLLRDQMPAHSLRTASCYLGIFKYASSSGSDTFML
jgi:hypothetical protein